MFKKKVIKLREGGPRGVEPKGIKMMEDRI